MARTKSRRSELKAFLTAEELALLSLGRAAEGFLWKHYYAQGVRAERDELWRKIADKHDTIWDEDETVGEVQACLNRVVAVHDDGDGEVWEEHPPREEWCEDCLDYQDLAMEAFMAGYQRKNARGSLRVAYKKVRTFREATDE